MPVLIFFSATIGVLYYLGLIQLVIEKIAFIMQFTLGTGAMESLHAAINIFVGWVSIVHLRAISNPTPIQYSMPRGNMSSPYVKSFIQSS